MLTTIADAVTAAVTTAISSWPWYDWAIAGYLGITGIANFGMMVSQPETVPWSKFAVGYKFKTPCPAKLGMLMKYAGAFSFSAYAVLHPGPILMPALMLAHFGKRILEVLCVHSFTGSPTEEASICGIIMSFYTMVAWLYVRAGQATPTAAAAPSPFWLSMFALAQLGNLYHHMLLRRLRGEGKAGSDAKGGYAVPRGGLFEYVACPHYLCEIASWGAAAALVPSAHTALVTFWVAAMLSGRSIATTRWYRDRFGDKYPMTRRHLIPGVF